MGIDFCNDTERQKVIMLFNTTRDMDIRPLYIYLCPVIIFVCFFSIIFNAILMSISRQSKFVNKSPILLLSLNLALTDLIASLLNGLGILFNSYLPEVYDIKMGQCTMLMFEVIRCAALVASALHLLALAFVHYRGIVNPLHYRSTIFFSQHLSRTINIISIGCWSIPLTIMVAWFSSTPCQGFQSPDCDYLFLLGYTFRYMVLTVFALPLLLMSIIYIRIFLIISKHQKGRRMNHEQSTLSRGVLDVTGPIGSAAAVDLPELILQRRSSRIKCPACAHYDDEDDPTISILSDDTNESSTGREGRLGADKAVSLFNNSLTATEGGRQSASPSPNSSMSAAGEPAQSRPATVCATAHAHGAAVARQTESSIHAQNNFDELDSAESDAAPQQSIGIPNSAQETTLVFITNNDSFNLNDPANSLYTEQTLPEHGRDEKTSPNKESSPAGRLNKQDASNSGELAQIKVGRGDEFGRGGAGPSSPVCGGSGATAGLRDASANADRKGLRERATATFCLSRQQDGAKQTTATAGADEEEDGSSAPDELSGASSQRRRRRPRPDSRVVQLELGEQAVAATESGGRRDQPRSSRPGSRGPKQQRSIDVASNLSLAECICDNKFRQANNSSVRLLSRANTIGSRGQPPQQKQQHFKLQQQQHPQRWSRQKAIVTMSNGQRSSISSSVVPSGSLRFQLRRPQALGAGSSAQNHVIQRQLQAAQQQLTDQPEINCPSPGALQQAPELSGATNLTTTNSSTYEPQRRHIHASAVPQTNTKALVTTLLILGTYFISYVPAIIYQVLTCIDNCPYPLYDISFSRRVLFGAMTTLLLIAKSIIDPFIYSYRMREIRLAINRYISKRRSKSSSLAASMHTSQRFNLTNTTVAPNANIAHQLNDNNNNNNNNSQQLFTSQQQHHHSSLKILSGKSGGANTKRTASPTFRTTSNPARQQTRFATSDNSGQQVRLFEEGVYSTNSPATQEHRRTPSACRTQATAADREDASVAAELVIKDKTTNDDSETTLSETTTVVPNTGQQAGSRSARVTLKQSDQQFRLVGRGHDHHDPERANLCTNQSEEQPQRRATGAAQCNGGPVIVKVSAGELDHAQPALTNPLDLIAATTAATSARSSAASPLDNSNNPAHTNKLIC